MQIIKRTYILIILLGPFIYAHAQSDCHNNTSAILNELTIALHKNDVPQILSFINEIEASCSENEFTARTKIIYQIINKENTSNSIIQYYNKNYNEQILRRWEYTVDEEYSYRYQQNKASFNYIPLRHAVDSLLKSKSRAILQSNLYSHINDREKSILELFTGDQTYFAVNEEELPAHYLTNHSEGSTFGIHAGIFMPLGKNAIFGNSPTIGLSYMSTMAKNIVFDLHYKARFHSSAKPFDFVYKEDIRSVEAKTSHVISLGLGAKVFDRKGFVILPKVNLGYGFIWTGLSETQYEEDEYGNEYESLRYTNVSTMHTTLGVSFLKLVSRKTYVGLETNLHLIPYNWDSNLKTPIPSRYASIEFFVRF